MELRNLVLVVMGLFTLQVHAQFGFFDQMFGGGGQQQQQQQQNVRSDSSWYQSQYENGTTNPHLTFLFPLSALPQLRIC